MMAAVGSVESADMPVNVEVRFAHQFSPGPLRDERLAAGKSALDEATDAWHQAITRLPRIRLLFGVDSDAAVSAQRASDAVGEGVLALSSYRVLGFEHQDDEAALEQEGDETSDTVRVRVAEATAACDDFSRAARGAIVESHWRWRKRAGRRSELRGADTTVPAEDDATPRV
jgi:hypothetical protein